MPNYEFTQEVRVALTRAQGEAVRLQHAELGPAHILLGICQDEGVGSLLRRMEVFPEKIRAALEARVPPGDTSPPSKKPRYSPQARKVLQQAMAAARAEEDMQIRAEHFLMALLGPENGVAAEVLRESGVVADRVKPLLPAAENFGPRRLSVEIDDSSDRSIYEQIVAQITEAVATGKLLPGDRLSPVRQQADKLDVAPGTVARAYKELEQQGIVITEGVRGTRIADRANPTSGVEHQAETLAGLLRPVAVAAYHLGASAPELREALETAMIGIFATRQDTE